MGRWPCSVRRTEVVGEHDRTSSLHMVYIRQLETFQSSARKCFLCECLLVLFWPVLNMPRQMPCSPLSKSSCGDGTRTEVFDRRSTALFFSRVARFGASRFESSRYINRGMVSFIF